MLVIKLLLFHSLLFRKYSCDMKHCCNETSIFGDTVFMCISLNDTIYINNDDIIRIDSFKSNQVYYLKEDALADFNNLSDSNWSLYLFDRNNNCYFKLEPLDIGASYIPCGYHVWTDNGNFIFENNYINVGLRSCFQNNDAISKKKRLHKRNR